MTSTENSTSEDNGRSYLDIYGSNAYKKMTSGTQSLIGGTGISLNGESIQVPDYDGDDVSSLNTSVYGGRLGHAYTNRENNIPGIRIITTGMGDQTLSNDPENLVDNSRLERKKQDVLPSDTDGNMNLKCVPRWIANAPCWLKFVIALSLALLTGAIALVAIALGAMFTYGNFQTSNNNSPFQGNSGYTGDLPPRSGSQSTTPPMKVAFPPFDDTITPVNATFPPIYITPKKTKAPEFLDNTTLAPSSVSSQSSLNKTLPPEDSSLIEDQADIPTADSSTMQSPAPTFDPNVIEFFVIGGRFTGDKLSELSSQLTALPTRGESSFLIHLGDWNSPYTTNCDEQSFKDVDNLYSASSIPVYFIFGDNDYNDCLDPEEAYSYWHKYLLEYETKHWESPPLWTVERQAPDYPENFAFFYDRVLFVGINLVGGITHDETEWYERQKADLAWIDSNYYKYKEEGKMEAMVLFAHADPDIASNRDFYEPFQSNVEKSYRDIQVVLVHRNIGVETWSYERSFNDIPNLQVVTVEGSTWPPLKAEIDFDEGSVFKFNQDES